MFLQAAHPAVTIFCISIERFEQAERFIAGGVDGRNNRIGAVLGGAVTIAVLRADAVLRGVVMLRIAVGGGGVAAIGAGARGVSLTMPGPELVRCLGAAVADVTKPAPGDLIERASEG